VGTVVDGFTQPGFEAVAAAFEQTFAADGELGAAVCVYKDGRPVVDLWGGYTDLGREHRWERDTMVSMASVDKFLPELGVLMLADRGAISLEEPVATYWPAFAQNGKEAVTVRQMLAGQAGLLYLDESPDGSYFNLETTIDALEKMVPEWTPGERGAYQSVTARLMHSELIRHVTGRDAGEFIRTEITGPLQLDYHYGLDEAQIARTAPSLSTGVIAPAYQQAHDRTTILGRAWRIYPDIEKLVAGGNLGDLVNQQGMLRSPLPLGSGYGAPRAIAKLFSVLANGGELDGVRILSGQMIDEMRTEHWFGTCGQTGRPFRFGLGVFLHTDGVGPWSMPLGTNPRAFGHAGAGGQLGVADPEARIGFAYGSNLWCKEDGLGPRCTRLLESVGQWAVSEQGAGVA
jgi:CubicO group peptidase (beta-lactamase class C family)